MTRNSHHSRGELLRTVYATADERRDGRLPMDVDGVSEAFDELTLLGALLLRWHTRLSGQIEAALLDQPLDLEAAVISAWHATADEMPGVRLIIDHHRDHPTSPEMTRAMATSTAKEHVLLAVMAGQAGPADPGAAAAGQRIELRARRTYVPAPTQQDSRTGSHAGPRLLGRLKAALVA